MGAAAVVALVACGVALVAAIVTCAAAFSLRRRTQELSEVASKLKAEALPLVRDARTVVDHAATEMERVGDVLNNAEAVSATVDSASRLAYRAFANPVVKTVAFGSGLSGALRRLVAIRASASDGSAGSRRRSKKG
jgi:HAMP domain-containing protein